MAENIVASAARNRIKQIDEAESKAVAAKETPATEVAESAGAKYDSKYTAAAAEARMKALKAQDIPEVKAGMPKPKKGVLGGLFD